MINNGMRATTLLILIFSFAGITGCAKSDSSPEENIPSIPFDKHGELDFFRGENTVASIDIEIADNDSSRVRGLMQRTSLPPESGMLFIFPVDEVQGFWMGNTQIALDLIYANSDSVIVSIAKYAQPMALETISSIEPARFTVEVPAGYADSKGIIEGDRIRWRRD